VLLRQWDLHEPLINRLRVYEYVVIIWSNVMRVSRKTCKIHSQKLRDTVSIIVSSVKESQINQQTVNKLVSARLTQYSQHGTFLAPQA